MNTPTPRDVATLVLIALAAACADGTPSSRPPATDARIAVAAQITEADAAILRSLAGFSLQIDNIHVVLTPASPPALLDTVVAFPAGADSVVLNLVVNLLGKEVSLQAHIELRSGNTILFSGSMPITASAGSTVASASIPVSYSGPGAGVVKLSITPNNPTILVGRSLQFSPGAVDAQGKPVTSLPLTWSSSNPAVLSIGSDGLATSQKLGEAVVTLRGLNGLRDSAVVLVVNAPASLAIVSGANQSAAAGSTLPKPFAIQVLDANYSPVRGIPVTFAAPAGGSVSPTQVVTADNGVASTTVTLGSTNGTYTYTAGVTGVSSASISAAATPAGARMTLQGSATVTTTAGVVPNPAPKILVADASGKGIAGVPVDLSVTVGTLTLFHQSMVTDANGIIDFGLMPAPTTTGTFSIVVSNPALQGSPITGTVTVVAAAPALLFVATPPSSSASSGAVLGQQPVIKIVDQYGNATTASGVVTATASSGYSLGGASSASASAGAATFSGLSISGPAGTATLTFSSGGLRNATATVTIK